MYKEYVRQVINVHAEYGHRCSDSSTQHYKLTLVGFIINTVAIIPPEPQSGLHRISRINNTVPYCHYHPFPPSLSADRWGSKVSKHLRNIKRLPCLHSLMQSLKEVWENSKVCYTKTFEFSQNSSSVCIRLCKHGKRFVFLL